jgi:S1-C subfamily serine protease
MGNPMGIGMSVTAGIVSALNRNLHDTLFDSYIQTDAAINFGDSGGPLIDSNGDGVGLASFIVRFLLDPAIPSPDGSASPCRT